LPSSLAWVLPPTLVCSTRPPVSDCGTGADVLASGFSWRFGIGPFSAGRSLCLTLAPRSSPRRTYLPGLPTGLEGHVMTPGLTPPRPRFAGNARRRGRNLNRLSVACASRPRLRPASPAADQPGCGTLGHPVGQIRTALALLVPTFALPPAPGRLPPSLLRRLGRSPTILVQKHEHPRLRRRA
jgi:hypothetical protein